MVLYHGSGSARDGVRLIVDSFSEIEMAITKLFRFCLLLVGWCVCSTHAASEDRSDMNLVDEQPESIAQPYQPKPIPVEDDAFTRWDLRAMARAMYQRIMHDAYQEHGDRDPAWDEDVFALIDDMIDYKRPMWDGALERSELLERVRAVLSMGSRDPLLFYFLGMLLQDEEEWHESKTAYLSAAVEYERRNHPLFLRCLLAQRFQRLYGTHGTNHEVHREAWQRRLAEWLPDAMAQDIEGRSEWRIMADNWVHRWQFSQISDEMPVIMSRLRETPGIDPWFLDIAEGRWRMRQAWDARGSGWASTVTEEGWIEFAKQLAKARTHLTRAWETYPDDSLPAALMITVAMAGHAGPGETMRMWFDRAVSAQSDHRPSYTRLLQGMLPRWGGTPGGLLSFGLECYRTGRYDIGIPFQLFRAIQYIESDVPEHTYWEDPIVARALQNIFLNYIEEGWPLRRGEYAAYLVGTAWLSKDYALAQKRLDTYGDIVDEAILARHFSLDIPRLREKIALELHPVSDDIDAIQVLFEAGDIDRVNELVRATRAKYEPLPTLSEQRLRDYELRADWASRLQTGEWIDLPFEAGLPGWRIDAGTWDVRDDGSVKLSSSMRGAFLLWADSPGNQFEVSGEFELVSTRYDTSFNAGFSVGLQEAPYREHLQITAFRQQQHVRWGLGNRIRPESTLFRAPVERQMSFGFQVYPDHIVIRFGDREETVEFDDEFNLPAGERVFGIGGVYWYEEAKIIFRNLRMRLLLDDEQATPDQSTATSEK